MSKRRDWRRLPGTLYAVASPDRQWVKVGFTTNLRERLYHVRCDYRGCSDLLAAIPSTFEEEQSLHAKLRPHATLSRSDGGPRELYRFCREVRDELLPVFVLMGV